jgi:hypothetical protein
VSVLIDGYDLSQLGLVDADIPEIRDGVDREWPLGTVPGHGPVHLSRYGRVRERRITITGTVSATTHAIVLANLDELKRRIAGRDVEIVISDELTRYLTGRAEAPRLPTMGPYLVQRATFLRWGFLCSDPYAYEATETTINFTAGAQDLPMGSAPVRPRLRLLNSVDPIVIYRDSAGNEQGRIEFTGTLTGELIVDRAGISLDGANSADALTGGDFLLFEPQHGTDANPATIELSSGSAGTAQVIYRRAWS